MRTVKTLAVILFLIIAAPVVLTAHPHMALDSFVQFELENEKCTSIMVELTFDAIFSAAMIGEYDKNRDGIFDTIETMNIKIGGFDNLKKFGYFVFLRTGTQRTSPENVTDFKAIKNGYFLTYQFRVPLKGTPFADTDELFIAIFDSSYYCQIIYSDEIGRVVNTDGTPVGVATSLSHDYNENYPVYYNPEGSPNDARIYTEWKRGLQITYPDEVRLVIGE